jgi:photoactive yellow protein
MEGGNQHLIRLRQGRGVAGKQAVRRSVKFVAFGADNVANVFARLSPEELDNVSFGVIQVDAEGVILLFNCTEGEIIGSSPRAAVGKNFFTDVALCTNEPGFRGRFEEGVRKGDLNVVFEWFLAGGGMPAVQVHMRAAEAPNRYWIFTKRL